MSGMSTMTRHDADRYLSQGKYAGEREILNASAARYVAVGVPLELAGTHSMHPLLDQVTYDAMRAREPMAFAANDPLLEPVSGAPDSIERWFRRDHVLDSETPGQFGFANHTGAIAVPSRALRRNIEDASSLLTEHFPRTWASCVPFVTRVFGADDPGLSGGSIDNLQSALVLGEQSNVDALTTACNLLHEALHCKSYRLFRSFNLVEPRRTNEFIEIPWWKTDDGNWSWSVDRAVVAAHVYTHIAQLQCALAAGSSEWAIAADAAFPRTAFRAQYLVNVLLQLHEDYLDRQRRGFVAWISAAVPPDPNLNAAGQAALAVQASTFANQPRHL